MQMVKVVGYLMMHHLLLLDDAAENQLEQCQQFLYVLQRCLVVLHTNYNTDQDTVTTQGDVEKRFKYM